MVTRDLLRSLRNDLPMPFTFRQLGAKAPHSKFVEGRFRFQCTNCKEILAAVNPRNNLGHCFHCKMNINNIDLMLQCGYGFVDAVVLLEQWLRAYNSETASRKTTLHPAKPVEKAGQGAEPIGSILRQEFENHGPQADELTGTL